MSSFAIDSDSLPKTIFPIAIWWKAFESCFCWSSGNINKMNTSPTHYFVLPLLTSYVYVCLCIQMLGAYGDKAELVQPWQRPELSRPANNLPSSCHLQGTGTRCVNLFLCCIVTGQAWPCCLSLYAFDLEAERKNTPELCQSSQGSYCEASPALWATCGHPGFRRRPCFSSRVLNHVSPNRQGCLSSHVLMRSQD